MAEVGIQINEMSRYSSRQHKPKFEFSVTHLKPNRHRSVSKVKSTVQAGQVTAEKPVNTSTCICRLGQMVIDQ